MQVLGFSPDYTRRPFHKQQRKIQPAYAFLVLMLSKDYGEPGFEFHTQPAYLQQGNASEKSLASAPSSMSMNTDLLFGVNYRLNDAISPFFGVSFRDFVLGLSYDVNSADLGKPSQGQTVLNFHLHI